MTTENSDLPRPEGHRAVPADEARPLPGRGINEPRDDERSREERDAERERRRVERERKRVERERKRAEDEAKLREQLRADCNIACESWSYDRLLLLDAVVNSLAMTGVMSEAITDAFRNVTEQKSATALLAEMQKARREREDRERREREERERLDGLVKARHEREDRERERENEDRTEA